MFIGKRFHMYETIDSAFGNYYQWNPPIPLLNALFSEKFYDASHRKEGKRRRGRGDDNAWP